MAQVKTIEDDPKVRSRGGKTTEITLEPTYEEGTSPLLEDTVLHLTVVGKMWKRLRAKPNFLTAEFFDLGEEM